MAKGKKAEKTAEDAINARRAQVSEWYWLGISQREMATRLEVSPATISADIASMRAEWLNDRKGYVNKWVNKELERIEWLEQEAEVAWENSKTAWESENKPNTKTGEVVMTSGKNNGIPYNSLSSKLSHGNPKYLETIRWCIEQRSKLLGLIVERHQHSGEDGKAIPITLVEVIKPNARSGTG